jgi:hypothetical protein
MLSVTMTNLQMKIIESKSKENFYSCEKTMDKIRIAVQEIAAEEVKNTYENDVLKNYATYLVMEDEDRNLLIQQKVIISLMKSLGITESYTDDNEIRNAANIELKSDRFDVYLTTSERATLKGPILLHCENEGTSIRINDLQIEYVSNDYRTSIASDIIITMPKFTFTESTNGVNYKLVSPFPKFTLVADKSIKLDNSTDNSASTSNIQGSVYAGSGGISIGGLNSNIVNQVNFNGENMITRGNITVSDTAKLHIGILNNPIMPTVWAKNLITNTTSTPAYTTDMNINAICIIQDDLVLEGRKSKVDFQSGAYIGYTGLDNTGKYMSDSSAMMINGSGSSLNLNGLSDLLLAGRAHVSVDDTITHKASDIMTGESIAFKSNQRAYLLPGGFITNILHNPVTQADTAPPTGIPIIDIQNDPTSSTEGINYLEYLATIQYKIAAKQTGSLSGDSTLRYYYFNFLNGKKADKYLKEYMEKYPDSLNSMEPFSLGNVTYPNVVNFTSEIVGNAMSYDAVTNTVTRRDGLSQSKTDDIEVDNVIAEHSLINLIYNTTILDDIKVNKLKELYSKLTHLLTLDSTKVYSEADEVVSSIIKAGGVNKVSTSELELSSTIFTDFVKLASGTDHFVNTLNPSLQSFHIVNGDAEIAADSVFNGILIASGKIKIENGAVIKGILLSTGENGDGTITVGNDVVVNGRIVTTGDINFGHRFSISTNEAIESYLTEIFTKEGLILKEVFKNAETSINIRLGEPALVDLTNMISYENWHKTE